MNTLERLAQYLKALVFHVAFTTVCLFGFAGCSLDLAISSLTSSASVKIIINTDTVSNQSVIPVSLIFSEPVTGITQSSISVDNGTISNFTGSGIKYDFDVTATNDGPVSINFPDQSVTLEKKSQNTPVAAEQVVVVVDTVRPTVNITSSQPSPTNVAAHVLDITFSEPVEGLDLSSFTLVGGGAVATSLTGSGAQYQLTVLPAVSANITVTLPQGSTHDAAGNTSFASNAMIWVYDVNTPLPTLSSVAASTNNLASIPVTIDFGTVSVFGLALGDFTVTNGTVSGLAGSGSSYTLNLIPSSDGPVSLQLPSARVQNALGSDNLASNTLSFNSDRTAPTLAVGAPSPTSGNKDTSFEYIVTYSNASAISLAAGDISFNGTSTTGCSASISGTGTTSRTVTVTGCTGDGTFRIAVAAGTATDVAGNSAAAINNATYATIDNTGPALVLSAGSPTVGNSSQTFTWTVTYTGANAVSLVSGDISLSGTATAGCSTSVSGSGTGSRVISVSGCTGNGSLAVSVAANTATDTIGNQALGVGPSASVTVDNTAPTLAISSPSPSAGNSSASYVWTVTYTNADSVTLGAADITLNGTATAGCLKSVTGTGTTTRTVTISGCTNDGTLGISVAAGSAQDTAGNSSAAAGPSTTATINNTSLLASLSSPTATNTNATSISVTLTTTASTTDLTAADLTLVNATVSGFTGSGTSYSFNLIPQGDGTTSVSIGAGQFHDSFSNANDASSTLSFSVDTVAPTLSLTGPTPALGTSATSFVWTATYSGANSVSLANSDITLTGTTAGCSAAVTGSGSTTRTITVSGCSGTGTVGLQVAANSASDLAGNQAIAQTAGTSATVDNTAPTLAFSSPSPTIGGSSATFVWTITYTGASSVTLANTDISLTGTATTDCSAVVAGTGTTTRTVSVSGCSAANGTVNISVAANSAVDAAGNSAAAGSAGTAATVDNSAPTLSFSSPSPSTGNSSTSFVWTITYSGAATVSLANSDISLGGTATAGCSAVVSGSGTTTRTVTVSGCSGDGTVNISVAANSAQSATSVASAATGPSSSATLDNTPPGLAINGPTPALGYSATSFVWTVDMTNAASVSLSSVTLTGTTAGCSTSITGSGLSQRTVTVSGCTGTGTVGFTVAAGAAEDSVGNQTASTASSTATLNNTAPTISIAAATPAAGNSSSTFEWTVTYTGASTIVLDNSFITLAGASAGCSVNTTSLNSTQYKVTVSGCTGDGSLYFDIAANSAANVAGVQAASASGSTRTVTVDNTKPTLSLSAPSPTSGSPSTTYVWTVTYSGASTITLAATDITFGGTTTGCSAVIAGTGSVTRTVSVSGCSTAGTLNITVAANTATDSVGNSANASSTSSDATLATAPAPTISIGNLRYYNGTSSVATGSVAAQFSSELTISGATEVTLNPSDITLTGTGTAGCSVSIASGATPLTSAYVDITNCTAASGTLSFTIAAGAANNSGTNSAAVTAGTSVTVSNPVTVGWTNPAAVTQKGTSSNSQPFAVSLNQALAYDVTLKVQPISLFTTAASGTDYTLGASTITIPAGATTASLPATYAGNNTPGSSKIIQLAITDVTATGAAPGVSTQVARRLVFDQTSNLKFSSISSNTSTTCGILSDKSMKCWGQNQSGQVGDGTSTQRSTPTTVSGGISWAQVSASQSWVCAISDASASPANALYCWGSNSPSLGKSGSTSSNIPLLIDGSNTYQQVSIGSRHGCAIRTDGTLLCWGLNSSGQVGDGSTTAVSDMKVIDAANKYQDISLGTLHTCGVTTANLLRCWGENGDYQVGDNSTTDRTLPVSLLSTTAFSKAAAGASHSCAITTTGQLYCWGNNNYGAAGSTSPSTLKRFPYQMDNGVVYTSVTAGFQYTCGITSTNVLKCWGNGAFGMLPLGRLRPALNAATSGAPIVIDSGVSYAQASVSFTGLTSPSIITGISACALTTDGMLKCWGSNQYGQLANGANSYPSTPVTIDEGATYNSITGNSYVSNFAPANCGITSANKLKCWGHNESGTLGDGGFSSQPYPRFIDSANNYSKISVGTKSTCAIRTDGKLYCWGTGYLGNGSSSTQNSPQAIDSSSTYSDVSVGDGHTCGLTGTTIKCWGLNTLYQINGTGTTYSSPTAVAGTWSFVKVSGYTTCAIDTSNKLFCWGLEPVSNNYVTSQTAIDASESYSKVAVGSDIVCGITTSGALKCWGAGSNGRLGQGSTTTNRVPTVTDTGVSYSKIFIIGSRTCGLTTGNVLKCWGSWNGSNVLTPTGMDGTDTYIDVGLSTYNLCAISATTNTVKCWGQEFYGENGLGQQTAYPSVIVPN
ncbi:Ig-like domain-containing protein [Bdellovibrio sp. HCB288]|uniref:Ig-like domain-containing protein n=1 Tax=Bdellovibrio sp. HCB288 TaxID=3394355 RepID=UPI0039B47F47